MTMTRRHAARGQHRLDFLSDSVIVHLDPDEPDPTTRCDCWRLTNPETAVPLPDHVCPETMRETVAQWASHMAEPMQILRRLDYPTNGLPSGPRLSSDSHLAEAIPWPLPMERGYLGLVIEQWVQEEPNAALAAELATNQRWQEAIATTRLRIFAAALDVAIDELPDDLSRRPVVVAQPTRQLRRQVAATLRFAGLPDTPRTVEHLLAAVAEREHPLPARGLLVATFVLVHPHQDGLLLEVDPEPDVAILGAIDAVSGRLLDEARKVVREHRSWIDRHLASGITLDALETRPRQLPRTRQPDPDSPRYDYLAEAGRDINSVAARVRHSPSQRREIIRDHLNDVYYRVHRRRKTAGLPLEPPQGWRVRARRRINELLDSWPAPLG